MKPRPRPNTELSVTKFRVASLIRFTLHSNDARLFVIKEAPRYGSVYTEGADIDLIVSAGYDLDEVAEYFESYNE